MTVYTAEFEDGSTLVIDDTDPWHPAATAHGNNQDPDTTAAGAAAVRWKNQRGSDHWPTGQATGAFRPDRTGNYIAALPGRPAVSPAPPPLPNDPNVIY